MIHVKAPNGLLSAKWPNADGPLGVGWTIVLHFAREFTDTGDARWWAKENAPELYEHIVTALGREYRHGDLRFPQVER